MYNEKLAAKVMVFLEKRFPTGSNFDEIKREFSRIESRENQWLLVMDALEKQGLISGSFIRTGIDDALQSVLGCQVTEEGRGWIQRQGINDLSRLDELAERRFQRISRNVYEPLRVTGRNLVEQFSFRGLARSSSFCHAVAELVFKQLATLRDAFIESYIGTLQETSQGVTPYREAWLNDKLENIWEEELLRARTETSVLAQSTGFSAKEVSPYAEQVMIRGRDLKKDIINEIRISALAPRVPTATGGTTMIHVTGDGNVIGDNNRVVTTVDKSLANAKSVELANAFAILKGEILELDNIAEKMRRTAVRAIEDAEDEAAEDQPAPEKIETALQRAKSTLEESGLVFDAAQGWGHRLVALADVMARMLPAAYQWFTKLS